MKRLYLLRHAQAAPAGGFADYERPLTGKGHEDAEKLGLRMQEKNYTPARIVCSSARRTAETLEGILKNLPAPQPEFAKIIYEGGLPELRHIITTTTNDRDSLLLIGHNPSIHQMVFELARDSGEIVGRLNTSYPPATLSVLDCPVEDWRAIETGGNTLIDMLLAEGKV